MAKKTVKKTELLTREQILAQTEMKKISINVPEWGGTFYVIQLNTVEMAEWQISFDARGDSDARLKLLRQCLVARTTCNSKGVRIFKDGDIEALGKMSYPIIDRLYEVTGKLNRVTKSDEDELVKNSDEAST